MTTRAPVISRWLKDAPATTVIAIACTLVWLVTAVQAKSVTNTAVAPLAQQWMLYGPAVSGEEFGWIRTVTSAFIHLDIVHLLMNMFFLLFIGREVERFLGTWTYTLVYFLCALGGSVAVLYNASTIPTAGASGALYGLMAIFVYVTIRSRIDPRGVIVLLLVNIGYTFFVQGISVWGHLGGLITGVLVILTLLPRTKIFEVLGLIAIAALVVVGLVLYQGSSFSPLA